MSIFLLSLSQNVLLKLLLLTFKVHPQDKTDLVPFFEPKGSHSG